MKIYEPHKYKEESKKKVDDNQISFSYLIKKQFH